jgi:hypothetical protein
MPLERKIILALMMIALMALPGCSSDDDDNPTDPGVPDDPRVASVEISPESTTFDGIGVELTFSAIAFDQESAPIDTVFTWQSSDPAVVIVDDNGGALSVGLGMAEIYATAGSVTDTADVSVTLDGAPVHEWIAGGSGNWEDEGNWSTGEVPGAGDVALITAAGTYIVALTGDVEVDGLVLGNDSGTQTLNAGEFSLRISSGGLVPGARLATDGEVTIGGDFILDGGNVEGDGSLNILGGGELHVTREATNAGATIVNDGALVLHPGSSLRINVGLENNFSGLVELQGASILVVQNDGIFNNSGTIHKSQGEDEASLITSSASGGEFNCDGPLLVDVGTLAISGGSLRGQVDIAEGATLRQSGNTELRSINSRGDGVFVVGGRLNVGFYPSQIVSFRHLVLDSASSPALSGVGGVLIDQTFVWRQGTVGDLAAIGTQGGSETTFEIGGAKVLSGTTWNISGNVAGDSNVDLTLREGAVISLEFQGRWVQTGGGTISQGSGDDGRLDVIGEFHKVGEGTFIVDSGFTCSGIARLNEGALTVGGDFNLFQSGLITGGGTDENLTMNMRLNLLGASSAVVGGTIRPDLDGQPANFAILGTPELQSTARIELDVALLDGPFNTESIYFLTSAAQFGGTLALDVLRPVEPGVDYVLVYSHIASGEFVVTGDAQFDEVAQDGSGVIGRQFN